jgi:hypothetical protein
MVFVPVRFTVDFEKRKLNISLWEKKLWEKKLWEKKLWEKKLWEKKLQIPSPSDSVSSDASTVRF